MSTSCVRFRIQKLTLLVNTFLGILWLVFFIKSLSYSETDSLEQTFFLFHVISPTYPSGNTEMYKTWLMLAFKAIRLSGLSDFSADWFLALCSVVWALDCSVGVVCRLRASNRRNVAPSYPLLLSVQSSTLSSPSLLFNGYRGLLPAGRVAGARSSPI